MPNLKKLGLIGLLSTTTFFAGSFGSLKNTHNEFVQPTYSTLEKKERKLYSGLNNSAYAQSTETKRPLDLPSGRAGNNEDEEDTPEAITFYGAEFEGDAFFWCLDKSCSMGWSGELSTLKQEVTSAINQLNRRSEFSAVAYSTNMSIWSQIPKKANSGNKTSAIAWVNTLTAEGWTCLAPAGVTTVNISNQSGKHNKQMIFVGDGIPTCDDIDTSAQCLTDITGANYQRTPINTLYISSDTEGITFMQQLASMNNGTFTQIN